MLYLVTYDICDAKRLQKVSSLLRRYGIRVQKSVFECRINDTLCCKMLNELNALCRDRDSVLVYGVFVSSRKVLKKQKKIE